MSYHEHLTAGLATIWDCTTSEAAERTAPKRKRISQDSVRGEVPWTAARCNRLLRTITSRVNILRKQSKLCAAGSSVRESKPSRESERTSSEESTPPPKDHRIAANDPEWIPGANPNAPSRTYGGKARSQQKVASRKADSGFSTPFVKRLLKTAPASMAKPLPYNVANNQHPKKTRQLPIQLASSNEEAQRNLVRAFDSLLMTTSPPSGSERTGARSLMSACLRRVPDYIDIEVEDIQNDDEIDEDIASSIYGELENLGTNSDGGWSGLREVVRSHGLNHVSAAIDEGLIHDARISELVSTCSKHGALLEADSLLRTWISRDHASRSKTTDDSHLALNRLAELRSKHDAPELYLRHHTDLILSNQVSPSDILRPGSAPLKNLIRGLVCGPGQDMALAYLEAAVIEDCATSNAMTLPVFSRLAGLLASLALAQAPSTDMSAPPLDLFAVVKRIATTISQHLDNDTDMSAYQIQNTARSRTTTHPFIMASTLLQLTSPSERTTIAAAPLDALISAIAIQQSAFVKFTLNVIHHVHRFSDADELESLLLTTSALLSPPPECSSENWSTLNRLAFEVAFAYSDQTGIDIDHHFTDKLAARNVAQTPRRRVHVSGYKWEEGLSEWVAATPLPKPLLGKALPNTHDQSPPKQLLDPRQEKPTRPSRTSTLVFPSSPDMITNFHSPSHSNTATPYHRSALQERSANQTLPIHLPSPQFQKAPSSLKPTTAPKQVHLKEERAKKAALLAQAAAALKLPKQVDRKHSHTNALAATRGANSESASRAVNVDTDELGMLTPARKKSKRVARVRVERQVAARVSLPAKTRAVDRNEDAGVMSEDELGL